MLVSLSPLENLIRTKGPWFLCKVLDRRRSKAAIQAEGRRNCFWAFLKSLDAPLKNDTSARSLHEVIADERTSPTLDLGNLSDEEKRVILGSPQEDS